MFCRCHGTSGTLPLPSYAIAVYSIPTTVQVQREVCKMEDLSESVVWRGAMGRGAIKTFLEAHTEVFDLEEEQLQNQRSAAGLPPFTAIGGVAEERTNTLGHKCGLFRHFEGFTQV